jgi:hypothetical protein
LLATYLLPNNRKNAKKSVILRAPRRSKSAEKAEKPRNNG